MERCQKYFTTEWWISTGTGTKNSAHHPIIIGKATGTEVMRMQLNEAVSKRLTELLSERNMTQYQLFMKSGVPKSTIGNVINCSYESVKLRIIHEMCQGLGITLCDFFQSPLFDDYHLDP